MKLETTGVIYRIMDAQQVTERFRKREFVADVTDNERYPQLVLFQVTGDRCEALDDYDEGDEVRIEFKLRGREWTSPSSDVKYFTSLDVWSMERIGNRAPAPTSGNVNTPPPDSDIPF